MAADRRFSKLLVGLVFAAAILVPDALATRSTQPVPLPTLYVQYTSQCTFTVVNDAGQPVTSIAPGKYELDVSTPIMFRLLVPGGPSGNPNDFTGCKGYVQFQMTGPGVSAFTTLDSGCSSDNVIGTWTLQPSATYTLEDLNQPSVTKMTITTLAGGTPQLPTTSPYDTTSGKGTISSDIVGSAVRPQGTLVVVLNPSGKLTLTQEGKPVTKLPTGRYIFALTDKDTKGGFVILGPKAHTPKKLTSAAFVGRKSATVMLTTGRWAFISGLDQIHFFAVTAAS